MRITDDLIDSIDNEPARWTRTNFVLQRDDYVMVWVANGQGWLRPYRPVEVSLPWRDRRRLWKSVQGWTNNMPLKGYPTAVADKGEG